MEAKEVCFISVNHCYGAGQPQSHMPDPVRAQETVG